MKYNKHIGIIFKKFPDFANSKELEEGYDKDIPYAVYAGFGAYFSKLVEQSDSPENNSKVIEICKFLNEMAKSNDKDTVDLLVLGFFESVWGGSGNSEKAVEVLKKCLDEPARTELKNLMEWKPLYKA